MMIWHQLGKDQTKSISWLRKDLLPWPLDSMRLVLRWAGKSFIEISIRSMMLSTWSRSHATQEKCLFFYSQTSKNLKSMCKKFWLTSKRQNLCQSVEISLRTLSQTFTWSLASYKSEVSMEKVEYQLSEIIAQSVPVNNAIWAIFVVVLKDHMAKQKQDLERYRIMLTEPQMTEEMRFNESHHTSLRITITQIRYFQQWTSTQIINRGHRCLTTCLRMPVFP